MDQANESPTTCFAALCRYRSWLDRWLIHDRMKFLVNNIGMSSAATRGRAFWKIWKPQYFRSGDDVEEKSDSASHQTSKQAQMQKGEINEPSTTCLKNSWNDAFEEFDDFVVDKSWSRMISQTKCTCGFQLPRADFFPFVPSSSSRLDSCASAFSYEHSRGFIHLL